MTKFVTTDERRANLIKLARFLWTEPIEAKRFNMLAYADEIGTACNIKNKCGTAGCAVGWAPAAGIKPKRQEAWEDFGERTLIDFEQHDNEWSFCFGSGWGTVDNTPRGAAKRILWALLNGAPSQYSINSQQNGMAPLIYADWTPTEQDWQLAAKGIAA